MSKLDRITKEYAQKQAEQREKQFLRGEDTSTCRDRFAGQGGQFARIAQKTVQEVNRELFKRRMRFERLCGVTKQREKHLLRVKTM